MLNAIRRRWVVVGTTILLAVASPLLSTTAHCAEGRRPFQGHSCPFDPQDVEASELEARLGSPMAPLERLICASWALQDHDAEKRVIGLKALIAESGPAEPALRSLVTGDQVKKTASLPPRPLVSDLVGRLVPLLADRQGSVRTSAANLLGLLGDPAAVPALSEHVLDPDPNVRREVITALGEIGDAGGLGGLIEAAHGRDPFTGFDAVGAIIKIGGPRAREALLGITNDRKLDRMVRVPAAEELRVSGDPVAARAAERYLASTRPQWKPAIYLAPLLYLLALMASRRGRPSGRNLWAWALYLAASVSIIFLINPAWFLTGQETGIFWGLALWYPIGVAIGVLPIVGWLKLRHHDESARAVGQRIGRCVLLMWGTLAAWVAVVFVLMIVGLGLAWR